MKEGIIVKFLRNKAFNGDPKLHYKMFKVGKSWVFTTIASFALTGAIHTTAQADSTD